MTLKFHLILIILIKLLKINYLNIKFITFINLICQKKIIKLLQSGLDLTRG